MTSRASKLHTKHSPPYFPGRFAGIKATLRMVFVTVFCVMLAGCDKSTPPPERLRVEDRDSPIGIDDPTPEFEWIMRTDAENITQENFQIQVASSTEKLLANRADLWDSGIPEWQHPDYVANAKTNNIEYQGEPLKSLQPVFWRVRTWDNHGRVSAYSAPARFEMGLLDDSDWEAEWIWRSESAVDDFTYFRHVFQLPAGTITSARLYISASHQQISYINGKKIGRGQPFFHGELPLYQSYSLDGLLNAGTENCIGVLAHWYGAGQGRPLLKPGLLAQIVVHYEDGKSLTIGSDKGWKTRPGEWYLRNNEKGQPITFINDEGVPAENVDGRNHPAGWNLSGFDDSAWKEALSLGRPPVAPWTGKLKSSEIEIEEHETAPLSTWQNSPGSFGADFGKVYAGSPVVRLNNVASGTLLKISEGYRLSPNRTVISFAQKTDMTFEYLTRGDTEAFSPFWYLGFRYLQVDGLPENTAPPELRLVRRHARMPHPEATFESSDAQLNKVWELAAHSSLYSAQEQFIDTPTREQGQFVYDSYLIGTALGWLYGERDLNQQALRGFAASQDRYQPPSGKLDGVYPNGNVVQDLADWSMVWLPWLAEYSRDSGDKELIFQLYEPALRTARWIEASLDRTTGLIDLGDTVESPAGLIDWPDRYEFDMHTRQRAIMSMNALVAFKSMAEIAELTQDGRRKHRFARLAQSLGKNIARRFWSNECGAYSDGLLSDGRLSRSCSQQTNAMMLALGLVPENRRAQVIEYIVSKGYRTSIIMTRFLLQAYGESGRIDKLLEFMRDENGLNYASILKDGATFTWENWIGRLKPTESSESHGMGAYAALMAIRKYVIGLRSSEPSLMMLKPDLHDLQFIKASFPTRHGILELDLRKESGKTIVNLNIPANLRIEVHGNRNQKTIAGSGMHRIELVP